VSGWDTLLKGLGGGIGGGGGLNVGLGSGCGGGSGGVNGGAGDASGSRGGEVDFKAELVAKAMLGGAVLVFHFCDWIMCSSGGC
jgi:hypothetical protein